MIGWIGMMDRPGAHVWAPFWAHDDARLPAPNSALYGVLSHRRRSLTQSPKYFVALAIETDAESTRLSESRLCSGRRLHVHIAVAERILRCGKPRRDRSGPRLACC